MAHLAADLAAPSAAVAWTTAAAGTAVIGGGASMRYAIVSIPVAARPVDRQAMTAMVSRAVIEVIAQAPAGNAGDATDPEPPPPPADDLADAVVAAHDARIAILRQQLAALREASGSVGDLAARLRRAEAARALALARLAGRDAALVEVLAPTPRLANVGQAAGGRFAPTIATYLSSDAASGVGGSYRLLRKRAVVQVAGPGRHPDRGRAAFPRLARIASVGHVAAMHPAPGHPMSGLAAARRSLAHARAVLGASPLAAPPRPALAGLWRWDGSDTWRLRSDRV